MRTAAFARHKERCGLCANPRTVAAFSGSDSINQGRDEGISNLIQNLHPFVFRFASGDPNAPNSRSKVQGSKFTGNGFQPFNRCARFKPFRIVIEASSDQNNCEEHAVNRRSHRPGIQRDANGGKEHSGKIVIMPPRSRPTSTCITALFNIDLNMCAPGWSSTPDWAHSGHSEIPGTCQTVRSDRFTD